MSIGKSTKNRKAAAKLINFLLNSKEGVETLASSVAYPLSKVAVQYLTEAGTIKENDRRLQACVWRSRCLQNWRVTTLTVIRRLLAQFGTSLQYIDYGQKSVEETAADFQRQA